MRPGKIYTSKQFRSVRRRKYRLWPLIGLVLIVVLVLIWL